MPTISAYPEAILLVIPKERIAKNRGTRRLPRRSTAPPGEESRRSFAFRARLPAKWHLSKSRFYWLPRVQIWLDAIDGSEDNFGMV